MALIKCPECGMEIEHTSAKCSYCGTEITLEKIREVQKKRQKKESTIGCLVVIGIIVLIAVVWQIGADKKRPKESSTSRTQIIDLMKIKLASPDQVVSILGVPTKTEQTKYGLQYFYQGEKFDIIFDHNLPQRMTINDLKAYSYDGLILDYLGLNLRKPDFSSPDVMRWNDIQGISELAVFPSGEKVQYIYIIF